MILHLRQTEGGGGGADRVIANVCAAIDKERFPFHVALLRLKTKDVSPLLGEMAERGVPVGEFAGGRLLDLGQLRSLGRLIRDKGIRLLHSHDPKSDVVARLLALFHRRVKTVSTLHGWVGGTRKSDFYVRLDLAVLRSFDKVIAVSNRNAEIARRAGVRRIEIVHNGIDTDWWRTEGERDRFCDGGAAPFTIGFVGRLSREKGPLDFVRLAEAILRRNRDCRFVVAGSGPEEGNAKSLARSLGIESALQFLGFLDPGALRSLYREMDVLALTSATEGLPMNALEASAMRVCVAAFDVGGLPEVVEDERDGILVGQGNVAGLAERIVRLAENPETIRAMGEEARRKIETRFSLRSSIRRIEAVYDKLLGRDPSRS
ncbi:glycosyltransferase family 4 protein [Candidatus Sumerlaeota bacterium]|nr:glycosyltransferase family 4 protein [Candidatus Sumerlaeota bacterium]